MRKFELVEVALSGAGALQYLVESVELLQRFGVLRWKLLKLREAQYVLLSDGREINAQ